MARETRSGDGRVIAPGSGVVPILKRLGPGRFSVIGTGFYVTRYGLFATARHVLEDLANEDRTQIGAGVILEDRDGKDLVARRIIQVTLSEVADVALGQAENGEKDAHGPANRRAGLALSCPLAGEQLVTYAYPENEVLDLTNPTRRARLKCDYFEGAFERQVLPSERPYIPYPHYETSIPIRAGASGCPIFNPTGDVVAIACRGWDFRGAEHEGAPLSSVVPVSYFLTLDSTCARVPENSWEYAQIPRLRRGKSLSFGELVAYGHIDFGTFRF